MKEYIKLSQKTDEGEHVIFIKGASYLDPKTLEACGFDIKKEINIEESDEPIIPNQPL